MIFVNLAFGLFTRATIVAHSAICSGLTMMGLIMTGKPPRRLLRRRALARLSLLPRP